MTHSGVSGSSWPLFPLHHLKSGTATVIFDSAPQESGWQYKFWLLSDTKSCHKLTLTLYSMS